MVACFEVYIIVRMDMGLVWFWSVFCFVWFGLSMGLASFVSITCCMMTSINTDTIIDSRSLRPKK